MLGNDARVYADIERRWRKLIEAEKSTKALPKTQEGVVDVVNTLLEIVDLGDGLRSIEELEKRLPPVIHVAGTKGKGSTCAFVEAICLEAGLRTGMFTSPHLIKINERFRLNGKPVVDEKLQVYFDRVWSRLEAANHVPFFFYFLVVLALHMFTSEPLDVVILEVGLGGRLDSTNCLRSPAACAITLLDYDHMEILGDTIDKIAWQKAGIMRKGVKAFTISTQEPLAQDTLRAYAEEIGCELEIIDAFEQDSPVAGAELGIQGKHQVVNACLAVALCKHVFNDRVSLEAIRNGLRDARWPGRSQIFEWNKGKRLFLDGAHTKQSMKACLDWYVSRNPKHPMLIFNCAHTKQTKDLIGALSLHGDIFERVVFVKGESVRLTKIAVPKFRDVIHETNTIKSDLAQSEPFDDEKTWQDTLCKIWRHYNQGLHGQAVESQQSLGDLISGLEKDETERDILVTGSLLLVGDVLKHAGFIV